MKLSADPEAAGVVSVVIAAQRGDRSAFAEIYAAYRRTVRGILLSRVPFGDVDDLVQDVFILAMERLPSLREPAAFPGWLATIARNRATDHLRAAPRTTELPEDLSVADADRTEALLVKFAPTSPLDPARLMAWVKRNAGASLTPAGMLRLPAAWPREERVGRALEALGSIG